MERWHAKLGHSSKDAYPRTDAISPGALGRVAGIITAVGSGFGLPLTTLLIAPPYRTVSYAMSTFGIIAGVFAWRAPWDRWPKNSTVGISVFTLCLLALGIYQGARPGTFALFFVVVFAWTGIAHGARVCLALAPLAVAVYVLPTLARSGTTADVLLVFYYIPVAILTGVSLGWITDRLRSAEGALRQLDQLKNEFVGMIAHDMRTTMTVITGFTDTMRERSDLLTDEQKEQFLGAIARNARRASEFVENLLQFARIEAREFTLMVRPFDLDALVHRVAEDVEGPDHPGWICVEVAPDLPEAMGDEDRNAQVLGNLLSNAMKFSPKDHSIEVIVGAAEGYLRVEVCDRGPGVAPEDIGKLFEKFASLEVRDGQKRAAGTGLGLYICRSIVEDQGGKIWVENRDGGGAIFTFTIPIAVGAELADQRPVFIESGRDGNDRVSAG